MHNPQNNEQKNLQQHRLSANLHPLDSENVGAASQIQARLLHLSNHLERMQAELQHLRAQMDQSGAQVDVIAQQLTDITASSPVAAQLAELLTRSEAYQEQLEEIASTAKKLTRVQFKANTLLESREQQISTALETLQEMATRREQLDEARQQMQQEEIAGHRQEARWEMAAEMLPVLDGLERALEQGEVLLARRREARRQREASRRTRQAPAQSPPPKEPALLRVMRRMWGAGPVAPQPARPAFPPDAPEDDQLETEWEESVLAWLEGLRLVRDRFLQLLAGEGIETIPALGRPFDPRLHVALAAADRPDATPGTVVEVVRPGYRRGAKVLRFAEVVVAQGQRTEEDEAAPVQAGA